MTSHHGEHKKSYILTFDLGERIESLRYVGLKTPKADDPFFSSLHAQMKKVVSTLLPQNNVVAYNMKSLVEDIWSKAVSIKDEIKDSVVISSCAEVSTARRGHTIEINRVVNEHGDVIGFGPRPGYASLDDQFKAIAATVDGSSVILAEDGTFTGSTLLYLLKNLQERGVNVSAIVIGISFPLAINAISKKFKGEVIVVEKSLQPFEWMPDHDFLPFTPNCGRIFGGRFGNEVLPHYTHDGISYCFPYVLPFGDPVKWASIPEKNAIDFSIFCMKQTLSLYEKLESINHKNILVKDLLGVQPRVSAPMTKGGGQFPHVDIPITEFINSTIKEF